MLSLAMLAEDTLDGVFNPRFKSLHTIVEGNEMSPPVISLYGNDRVTISFDELSDERSYLRYSLVHCNALWQPSGLVESEFLDGFNIGDVEEYSYSQATTINYIHYAITIPNEQVRFTVSGNYLLRVFQENNPDEIILQARFSVSENLARISGEVTPRTDIDYLGKHQQLNFAIDTKDADIRNIYTDLKVIVSQNSRKDNMLVLSAPQRVSGDIAYYEHLRPLIYPAGNEYRRFETTSTTYPGMNVEAIAYEYPYYHQKLYDDYPRKDLPYLYDMTQHGRFKPMDTDNGGDYVMVHFALESDPIPGYDIFIEGDLTHGRFNPESMMHYDISDGKYKASMLLKQGSYNYQYLAVPSGSLKGETAPIEGNFHNTVNEYGIGVYYRTPGTRYDRLLGYSILTNN
ncbi:MAG: DUF5103 domain-containing protein [Lachnospiraceae bacterium]|nr:DUF5103 domain-containing protein [Lachnospiraceae bacterium]